MKALSSYQLITTLENNLELARLFTPIFIYIIIVIIIILLNMAKPIRRFSSKLFSSITSAFSTSHSHKSTSSPPPPPPPVTTATPVISEFPDAKTAALLQTVPSQHELLTFDEIQRLEKSEEDPCLNCLDPCFSHENYPSYLKIDYESPLENTVKPYIKHVLISTGKGDWQTNIEDESDSLAANLNKVIKNVKLNEKKMNNGLHQQQHDEHENTDRTRIIITNSSRKNTDNDPSFSKGNDVLIFPENILIKNVTTNQAMDFYNRFLLSENVDIYDNTDFSIEKMPYKAIVVICSHRRRDKRCGVTGPLLKEEFDKILKEKGLDPETCHNDGVGVFLSSHTGGHRFAGNIIVYKEGKGIWYGRVIPCHVKSIIEHTIIEGKVIKDLYRGSMNGSFVPDCGGRKFDW